MSTRFSLTRDINGYNGFGVVPPDDMYSGLLSTGAAQSVTVPSNHARWMIIFAFEPGASVWVAVNSTAVVPAGAISASRSELNPVGRQLKAGDIISFITPNPTATLGVLMYAL